LTEKRTKTTKNARIAGIQKVTTQQERLTTEPTRTELTKLSKTRTGKIVPVTGENKAAATATATATAAAATAKAAAIAAKTSITTASRTANETWSNR